MVIPVPAKHSISGAAIAVVVFFAITESLGEGCFDGFVVIFHSVFQGDLGAFFGSVFFEVVCTEADLAVVVTFIGKNKRHGASIAFFVRIESYRVRHGVKEPVALLPRSSVESPAVAN